MGACCVWGMSFEDMMGEARRGEAYMDAHLYEEAINSFGSALHHHRHLHESPRDTLMSNLWYNTAQAYLMLNDERGSIDALRRATQILPNDARALMELGSRMHVFGYDREIVLENLKKAESLFAASGDVQGQFNSQQEMGSVWLDDMVPEKARTHFLKALEIAEDNKNINGDDRAFVRLLIGLSYCASNRYRKAKRYFRRALKDRPKNGGVKAVLKTLSQSSADEILPKLKQTAHAFFTDGERSLEEAPVNAKKLLLEALRFYPRHLDTHHRLGLAYVASGMIGKASQVWNRSFHLSHVMDHQECTSYRYERGSCMREGLLRHKLLHDLEHVRYLGAKNDPKASKLIPSYEQAYAVLDQTLSPAEADGHTYEFVVTEKFMDLLGGTTVFKRDWANPSLPPVQETPINYRINSRRLQRWYDDEQIIYVDDILTPEALDAVYRICTERNDFHNVKPWGYLGAYLNDGFHHPTLLKIASELRRALPKIFDGHELMQLWAYKYSQDMEGIKMHGDDAAVNVNIWITPNDANKDPNSGGLVVYRRFPPDEWGYKTFNHYSNEAKLEKYFKDDAVTIPHRQNRAVIFNSYLWHKTDRFSFKKGYPNRRINLTLLFGLRAKQQKSRRISGGSK